LKNTSDGLFTESPSLHDSPYILSLNFIYDPKTQSCIIQSLNYLLYLKNIPVSLGYTCPNVRFSNQFDKFIDQEDIKIPSVLFQTWDVQNIGFIICSSSKI
jgi:hypothetical protein